MTSGLPSVAETVVPSQALQEAALRTSRTLLPWGRLLRAVSGKDTLAVLDQAVVSGTSFLTTVLIGRWCGAGELGIYSLGFTLLVAWTCVQESLVGLPYTICRHRLALSSSAEANGAATYAGSILVHQALLSALAFLVLALIAAALSSDAVVVGLGTVTWVLAVITPFALLREFGRRYAFAHLRIREALVLDLVVAALQLAGLTILAATDALSAGSAYVTVGAACALTGVVWLYLSRTSFSVRWADVRPAMRQSWSLGKWLFASQLTLSLQAYFVHWLLAWVVGATATGVYAACMTVVLFANPLFLGISNSLAPKAAKAFSDGGRAELWHVVLQTTWLLGAAMALFCAVVFCVGEEVLGLLYRGGQYAGHGQTIAVLALAMLASTLGMPASNGLAAMERPRLIFVAGLIAVILSVLLVPFFVAEWGVTGAAYGFLAGNVAGSVGRWLAFAALIGKVSADSVRGGQHQLATAETIERMLQQFTSSKHGELTVEPLNEGAQAVVLAARPFGATDLKAVEPEPMDGAMGRELVVKLFKAAAGKNTEAVRRQFEAMARLHFKLDGRKINGWTIHAPLPLYQCERPLAIVMTMVPGRSLNACLGTRERLSTEALESIAETIITAMEPYWSVDAHLHGDFNFDNILCDPAARSLSFVDAGVLEHACVSDSAPRHPASRDLAHLLFETEVGVKKMLGKPGVRRRQRYLAERVVRVFLKKIGPLDERRRLLEEVHACARVHLDSLRTSWTPRGWWRGFVRRIATRRIDAFLGKVRAENT